LAGAETLIFKEVVSLAGAETQIFKEVVSLAGAENLIFKEVVALAGAVKLAGMDKGFNTAVIYCHILYIYSPLYIKMAQLWLKW